MRAHTHAPTTMTKKGRLLIYCLLAALVLPVFLASCGEDRWPAYYPYTGRNLWIDSVMRHNYMWANDMPSSKSLTSDYFKDAVTFLNKVKSSDDNVSSIDTTWIGSNTAFGYGYELALYQMSDTAFAALVTYVDSNSPADEASINRGEWIMAIDDQLITNTTRQLLTDGYSHALTMGTYGIAVSDTDTVSVITPDRIAVIPAATSYTSNPVPVTTTVGNSTGYVVVNSLNSDNISRIGRATQTLANAGISSLVLDLRYCSDGDIRGMAFLASVIASRTAGGSILGYMNYADSLNRSRDEILIGTTDAVVADGGNSLNLSSLYVLTGSATSGTPEILINCLKPYINVVVIGETTAGEAVACETFTNEHYSLSLHLATAYVTNSEGTATYSGIGIEPDYDVNPLADPATVLPLGNPSEALLSKALAVIAGE